jgi:hypothetical protein
LIKERLTAGVCTVFEALTRSKEAASFASANAHIHWSAIGVTAAVVTRFIFHSQGPKALPTKHNLACNDLNTMVPVDERSSGERRKWDGAGCCYWVGYRMCDLDAGDRYSHEGRWG